MHVSANDALFGGTTGLGAGLSGVIIQEAPPMTGSSEAPTVRIMTALGADSDTNTNQQV
jgi:hypothetical protein